MKAKPKTPDFSNCVDPEFAKIQWEYSQYMLKIYSNNPLRNATKDFFDTLKEIKGKK